MYSAQIKKKLWGKFKFFTPFKLITLPTIIILQALKKKKKSLKSSKILRTYPKKLKTNLKNHTN